MHIKSTETLEQYLAKSKVNIKKQLPNDENFVNISKCSMSISASSVQKKHTLKVP